MNAADWSEFDRSQSEHSCDGCYQLDEYKRINVALRVELDAVRSHCDEMQRKLNMFEGMYDVDSLTYELGSACVYDSKPIFKLDIPEWKNTIEEVIESDLYGGVPDAENVQKAIDQLVAEMSGYLTKFVNDGRYPVMNDSPNLVTDALHLLTDVDTRVRADGVLRVRKSIGNIDTFRLLCKRVFGNMPLPFFDMLEGIGYAQWCDLMAEIHAFELSCECQCKSKNLTTERFRRALASAYRQNFREIVQHDDFALDIDSDLPTDHCKMLPMGSGLTFRVDLVDKTERKNSLQIYMAGAKGHLLSHMDFHGENLRAYDIGSACRVRECSIIDVDGYKVRPFWVEDGRYIVCPKLTTDINGKAIGKLFSGGIVPIILQEINFNVNIVTFNNKPAVEYVGQRRRLDKVYGNVGSMFRKMMHEYSPVNLMIGFVADGHDVEPGMYVRAKAVPRSVPYVYGDCCWNMAFKKGRLSHNEISSVDESAKQVVKVGKVLRDQ